MKTDNKQLKQDYKQGVRPMGVFQIRNLKNEKIFVVSGLDLAGALNRHKFQLQLKGHANKQLQQDWTRQGADDFAFEVLDQMNPSEDAALARRDLATLEDMWLDRLKPYAERGYNEPKITRNERLRRIAARRAAEE